MEPSLIAELSKFGPLTLLGGMALFMLRDEIRALLGSGRRDNMVEGGMSQMVALFTKNLAYFEALTKQSEKWVEHQAATKEAIDALHETQRQVLNEMVRGVAMRGQMK
jgi:hypothetical protein